MLNLVAQLSKVSLAYGDYVVLKELNMNISIGEILAIVGPSGCGKSTLLSILAGRLKPTKGNIYVEGGCRTVHQTNGLFPWLTVEGNIRIGLHGADLKGSSETEEIERMLFLVGASASRARYPHELSGGIRQRVELARALAGPSELLLLDEPFSALDYISRLDIRKDLMRILELRPRTVVLVTHDLAEAAQLAYRILVLNGTHAGIAEEIKLPRTRTRELINSSITETVERLLSVIGQQIAPAISKEII